MPPRGTAKAKPKSQPKNAKTVDESKRAASPKKGAKRTSEGAVAVAKARSSSSSTTAKAKGAKEKKDKDKDSLPQGPPNPVNTQFWQKFATQPPPAEESVKESNDTALVAMTGQPVLFISLCIVVALALCSIST